MYTRLTLFLMRVTLASLLGVGNYLTNHFAIYICLARFRMGVELATPAFCGLKII